MLSRARYEDGSQLVEEDEDIEDDFYVNILHCEDGSPIFCEEEYEGELSHIRKYLQKDDRDPSWSQA
jgi:hypothetical protein